jgi:hypothetical protein
MQMIRNLIEVVILIVGMPCVISEIVILFTRDMRTEFSFTVEGKVYCKLSVNSPLGQNAYCFVHVILIGHFASWSDLVSVCVYP